MFKKKECVAMLLAGGQGSRLYALTKKTAKPAVSFGGKFRIIDFPLSNCINSGVDTVGVLTQYQPLVLNEYIGNGLPWDLDRTFGGVSILPPYQGFSGSYAITNNHHTEKTAILELLKWMTSAESSEAITNATGMIPARKDVVKNYAVGSPEYTLLKQLELSGKERPATVAYPTFSTTFNQVIAGLGNGDVSTLLNSSTNTLQTEMDRLKKLK